VRIGLDQLVIDAVSPGRLVRFWAALLGGEPVDRSHGWSHVEPPGWPRISFQPVPEPRSVKNRLHPDLAVDDIAAAVAAAELARVLPSYGGQLNVLLGAASDLLATIGVGPAQIQAALDQFDLGSVVGVLQGFLAQFAGLLTNLLLILSVLLFMAIDSATFPERMRSLGRTRPHVVEALMSFAHGTRRFLAVATVFGLTIAVLDVAVLWVLGVPLALLFGLVSFIANFVPNIGFVIALAPPALLALLEGGPRLMLAVIVSFLVINVALQTVLQPRFVGDAVGLSVTVTFVALVFWSFVLGPLGALLAIPLTLLAKALLVDIHPYTRWIDVLIRDDVPTADPPAPEVVDPR
jgi:predicted PurR-regulated permease PerM